MSDGVDRRRFLRGLGVASALGLAGCGRAPSADELAQLQPAAPAGDEPRPRHSAKPGTHELLPLPYPTDALELKDDQHPKLKGISRQVVEWHHDKHHAGYVKALNAIETEVAGLAKIEASPNYSEFAELKRRETFNASGMVLHDLYWHNLTKGGAKASAASAVVKRLVADFGSFERWQEEFIGTANTPNAGWAILALAPYDGKLHNFACAFHDLGGVWGAVPLIALDVWEHAYYYDYGPDRGSYIESFLRLLNWPAIDSRYRAVARSMVR